MSDLISRQRAIASAISGLTRTFQTAEGEKRWIRINEVRESLNAVPSVEAIPVSWIEERIENAITADQTLIARMWQELINGYRREHERNR